MAEILVVDDDVSFGGVVSFKLKKENHSVAVASSSTEALNLFKKRNYDVCLLDFSLPDGTGLELFRTFREIDPECIIFMISGQNDIPTVVDCIQSGVDEYFVKPFSFEELRFKLQRVIQTRVEAAELRRLREKDAIPLVGSSEALEKIRGLVSIAAAQDNTTVLITGETGTGKEVVARRIHALSGRAEKSFYAVNCSGVPETLIESEYFGYEKGAFTGADHLKKGIFEQADGGTVFLDEIGDMPPAVQAKMLRFLEERRVQRLGGGASIPVDVRIICATNRNLEQDVARGLFRQDLYYRVNVLNINIPPLRERIEDIIPIAEYFIQCFYSSVKLPVISAAGMKALSLYQWPGNVRELRNVIERELIVSTNHAALEFSRLAHEQDYASPEQLEGYFSIVLPDVDGVSLDEIERQALLKALELHDYNISRAARFLHLGRSSMRSKMSKHGIEVARN